MTKTRCASDRLKMACQTALCGGRSRLGRFHREEDGVFIAFSMFIMVIILMVAGIGVDTMRFEMERTRLQNTVDRAVLAAADLDQTLAPKAVVEDYFVKAGITDVVPVVDPKTGVGYHLRFVLIYAPTQHRMHSVLPHKSISAPETEKPQH